MLWLFTTVPEKLEKMSEGHKTFLLSKPDWQCSVHKFLGQLMSPRILNYIYSINLTYRYTAHHMHTCLLLAQFHRMINIKYLLTIQLRDSVSITMKEIYQEGKYQEQFCLFCVCNNETTLQHKLCILHVDQCTTDNNTIYYFLLLHMWYV